jgi:uncharacterized protein (DUF2252 family)
MRPMETVKQRIDRFNAGRDAETLALKYKKMADNAFDFLRGTAHLFYDHLPDGRLFSTAPPAWSCGDLHLENFGSYRGSEGQVYFDINDFDQAALAPASIDLLRLLSSVMVATTQQGGKPATAHMLCLDLLDGYTAALGDGRALWVERDTADGLIGELLQHAHDQPPARFLAERCERDKLRIDKKQKPLPEGRWRRAARLAMASGEEADASAQSGASSDKVLDAAQYRSGIGGLGLERYVVLVGRKKSPDSQRLLDIKETGASQLAAYAATLGIQQPAWRNEAQRVVALQMRMQARSMPRLRAVGTRKRSYVLRELQPAEDRVDLHAEGVTPKQLAGTMRDFGRLVAWAQLRSSGRGGSATADDLIAFGKARKKWQPALLAASERCAAKTQADWKAFKAAV